LLNRRPRVLDEAQPLHDTLNILRADRAEAQ
jgi:hypothetical protein